MNIISYPSRYPDEPDIFALDFFGNGDVLCFRSYMDWWEAAVCPKVIVYHLPGQRVRQDLPVQISFPMAFAIHEFVTTEPFWTKFCAMSSCSYLRFLPELKWPERATIVIGSSDDLAILRMML